MAHNCPKCGRLCYCDMEDIDWGDNFDEECFHECDPADLENEEETDNAK